ncbi:fanconi-associated nuclease 1-like [Pseudomyrmex gracilis]|uniref:fanconi-associated nuclease 1-like n=1 Tax=Pseudomyrmex gracilis TaxID=219809 RepID=UPI0009953FC9|nr:fanconi-associated nuclease 1-like [Pseudomyrmex gracilis]
MAQTRIDQFYKVTNRKTKVANENYSIKKSSKLRNTIVDKTEEQSSQKVISIIYNKRSPRKGNRRQKMAQSNNSSSDSQSLLNTSKNSPTKVTQTKTVTSPITNSPRNSYSPASSGSSKFTPKTASPIKNAFERTRRNANLIRKKLFKDKLDEMISEVIENLNLAKEGAIANNDIDLEKVYASGDPRYKYNCIDTTTSMRYEINDVVVPTEMTSYHFFLMVVTVFSKPINCGYFGENELDLIYKLITLSRNAQALFVRMLKRKHTWHRISSIDYKDVSSDLKPVFDELVSHTIFKTSLKDEDTTVLINLLSADEIRKLCQELKINAGGKKKNHIEAIMQLCKKTKSLFPGMPSPAVKVRSSVIKRLGDCVLLNTTVKELVDRIITLLMPNRDPTETLYDTFFTILKVEKKEVKLPEVIISDFPLFSSKKHLLDYIEAKSALTNILSAIEDKEWNIVRELGDLAFERLPLLLEMEGQSLKDSALPQHVRHFMPGYMWLKVLSKSIDAFKKTKEFSKAIEFLQTLINQQCHMKNKKGQWYCELIKIENFHKKNLDDSVALLSKAVKAKNLTEVDRLDLLDRAEKLVKRKTGISQQAKEAAKNILDNVLNRARPTHHINNNTIQGTLCSNVTQKKSNWCIINDEYQQLYGSVENLALYHYKQEGYLSGVHCEGAFPVLLFGILFWEEIYNINIPGAHVSPYQDAPLDLYSSQFYENRKEQIDMKLEIVRKFDVETLSKHLQDNFNLRCEYKSVANSQGNIFSDKNSLQELTVCLGVEGIVGICERLIHNFILWRAGFPDLIVWNIHKKQHKIVEVKGPGDTLSTKQKLWLDYLSQLGLNVEVCYCESDAQSRGVKRKHSTTEI